MKTCTYCKKDIDDNSLFEKYCMIITKRGQKIIEFECFHFDCWKEFMEVNVGIPK